MIDTTRLNRMFFVMILVTSFLTVAVGADDGGAGTVLHRQPDMLDMTRVLAEALPEQDDTEPAAPDDVVEADDEADAAALVAMNEGEPLDAAVEPARVDAAEVTRSLPQVIIRDLEVYDEVDVVTMLRLLAKVASVNMLISPDVEGTVGFAFREIPWDQAFLSVVESAGLTYRWQGDVLRVLTVEDVRRELELETVLRDRQAVQADLREVEPLTLEIIPVRYISAMELSKTIARVLDATMIAPGAQGQAVSSAAGVSRATVALDAESNQIIVHARQEEIGKVLALVERLDQPRPLVKIEAKIVEASQDMARQLGLQWGVQSSRFSGGRIIQVGGQQNAETASGYVSDFPAQFVNSPPIPAGFILGGSAARPGGGELLSLQLSALQQDGDIEIKASPTVTTLDNETAMIESGEERAYRVSTGTGNELDVSVEWKKAVLMLEVTPHVVDENLLRVDIVAHKDSFDETKPQTNNEFPVNTKRARTTVLLANGDTTMIGGFSVESRSDTSTGVPILMRIPLLGRLFKNSARSARNDETIIFITPTIL